MGKFNLEDTKKKISDVKGNLEGKQEELEKAKESKQALLNAGTDIQGSELDEETQRLVMEFINEAIEENSEKAKEISSEMNNDLEQIEDMKQEVDDNLIENDEQKSKLESTKGILDKFGIGDKLDGAMTELDENHEKLDETNLELNDVEKELMDLSSELQNI
ncbi:MAG: hypothetical protein LUG12_10535 [Erysipelotrichaceae bacterium]|nr:hypothetical protein [Erysipelotrichaceae bacterium]